MASLWLAKLPGTPTFMELDLKVPACLSRNLHVPCSMLQKMEIAQASYDCRSKWPVPDVSGVAADIVHKQCAYAKVSASPQAGWCGLQSILLLP